MSYILDALRKADSDRERGAVPGIHTQSVPGVAGDPSRTRSSGPLVWVVLVLSALVVALLGWLFFGRETAAPVANAPAAVAAVPPPVITPAPTVVAPAAPAPVPRPPQVAVAPRVSAPPPAKTVAPVTPAAPPAQRSAVAQPPAKAASSEPRIYAVSELPESIRRELPQVVVGGSIYSENAANRFLIINGQVFHEGDKLGPDLWLDQIKLKAAVLRYKDYRYTLRF